MGKEKVSARTHGSTVGRPTSHNVHTPPFVGNVLGDLMESCVLCVRLIEWTCVVKKNKKRIKS